MPSIQCPACKQITFVVDESKCWTTYPGQYRATCSECGFVKKVFEGGRGEDKRYFHEMNDAVYHDRLCRDNFSLKGITNDSKDPPSYGGGDVTGFQNFPKRD